MFRLVTKKAHADDWYLVYNQISENVIPMVYPTVRSIVNSFQSLYGH